MVTVSEVKSMRALTLGGALLGLALTIGCFGDLNTQNDLDPPIVRISQPQANDSVFGQVIIHVDAIDGFGVASVRFYIDDNLISTDFVTPYQAVWNASGLSGVHAIKVEARDEAGNSSSETITVTVGNPRN
jgi:hypothetical protein